MPKPLFHGPKSKIERAKRHIAEFRSVFRALDNTDFVRYELQPNPYTAALVNIVLAAEFSLPDDLTLSAADALYNLRSALDQAACRCAVLAGKSPNGTYFPHGKDRDGFDVSIAEKCKKVPVEVRTAITALQPYYGGHGYLIRSLHDLNLVDKHTDLLTYMMNIGQVSVSPGQYTLGTGRLWQSSKYERRSTEDLIFNRDHGIKIAHAVTFDKVKAIKDEPVAQVLHQICDLVARTVEIMERECRLIGLLK